MSFTRAAAIAATLLILPLAPQAGSASTVTGEMDAKNKINLSGRQRMLIQRMAKAACFVHAGIETNRHRTMVRNDMKTFATTLDALEYGDDTMGLLPENDPIVVEKLNDVRGLWVEFEAALQDVLDRPDRDALEDVAARDIDLLATMNAAVREFELTYGAVVIDPELATTINVAGRQRMLTQRASKEFCLVYVDLNPDAHRRQLDATLTLFETSLSWLQSGYADEDITAPLSTDQAGQLDAVGNLWAPFRGAIDAGLGTDQAFPEELATVAGTNDALMREMNTAVEMYFR